MFGGIKSQGSSSFSIYPNLANSILTIKNEKENLLEIIEIRDISNGNLVKTAVVNSKNKKIGIDVKALKQGHYILIVYDSKGNVVHKGRLLINK